MAEITDIMTITTDVERVLAEELEAGRKAIIENSKRAGQEASGKTYRSMRVEVLPMPEGGVRGVLSARPFFAALETGSRPWTTQYKTAPKFFAEIIEDWLQDKGLTINPYAVATTIMRKGSKLYRQGGRRDIFTPVVEEVAENVQERTAGLFQSVIMDSILKYTKENDTI